MGLYEKCAPLCAIIVRLKRRHVGRLDSVGHLFSAAAPPHPPAPGERWGRTAGAAACGRHTACRQTTSHGCAVFAACRYEYPHMYTSAELNAATVKLIHCARKNQKILGIFLFGLLEPHSRTELKRWHVGRLDRVDRLCGAHPHIHTHTHTRAASSNLNSQLELEILEILQLRPAQSILMRWRRHRPRAGVREQGLHLHRSR